MRSILEFVYINSHMVYLIVYHVRDFPPPRTKQRHSCNLPLPLLYVDYLFVKII